MNMFNNLETNGIVPVMGDKYKVMANDIISQWEVELTYLGSGEWSHPSQNVDGVYPPIVHEILEKVSTPDSYDEPHHGMTDSEFLEALSKEVEYVQMSEMSGETHGKD